MKIRADFVTNSSSSSFTIIGLDSPMVENYLKENPVTFTPVPSGADYGKKFSEQPTKTYTNLKELLGDIARAQDNEIEIDEDLDEMHFQVPQSEEWVDERLYYDLDCAWELYAEENQISDDDYEAEYQKFSSEYMKNHGYPTDDFLRRISYEYLDEISDYGPSERVPQLKKLKEYIQENRKEFILQSGCLYMHMLGSQGGMSGWIGLNAYVIKKGVPQYLHQEYYAPSQWDYCPVYMTKSERHDLICKNLEELESFLGEWPDALAKVREDIGGWLDYAWRLGINSFVSRETVIEKIKNGSIDFKNIPAKYKKDEEVLLLCIENDVKGTKLPKNIMEEIKAGTGIEAGSKVAVEELYSKIKSNPVILHDACVRALRGPALEKIEKNWKAVFKIPQILKDDPDIKLAALMSYATSKDIPMQPGKEINLGLAQDLIKNSSAGNIRLLISLIPEELLKDENIQKIAKNKGVYEALKYATRQDVLSAVKKIGSVLKYASEELKNDREIVLAAVKQNCWAFRYASEELQSDREFVLEAVQQSGGALLYASEELQNDQEIVEAAMKNEWR